MKKKMRRLGSFILALFLVLSLLPTSALAEETAEHTTNEDNTAHFSLGTEQVLGVGKIQGSVKRKPVYAEKDNGYYTDVKEAIALLREKMVDRRSVIEIPLRVGKAEAASVGGLQALIEGVFALALAHTGVEDQGDYLLWSVAEMGYQATYMETDNYYYLDIPYEFIYYTTLEQEVSVGRKLDSIFASFGFTEQTDDYTKIKTIYDYICANVTYDYANLENDAYTLKYTAYAALNNGTAVCQGYAALLYRMLLRAGIDCRVISGVDDTNGAHAWNIVALDGVYYNMDSTWDAGYDEYRYFLKGSADFPAHFRDAAYDSAEFHTVYPMAAVTYNGGETAVISSGTCGEGVNWVLMNDGILTVSGNGAMDDYANSTLAPWYDYRDYVLGVVVEEGVTRVGNQAFQKYENLQTVSCAAETIGESAFYLCDSLVSVELLKGVKEIGNIAFLECNALSTVTFPATVEKVGGAFFGCPSLNVYITDLAAWCDIEFANAEGNPLAPSGSKLYLNGEQVTDLVIPEGITAIGNYAFPCGTITTVSFPASVKTIGAFAFYKSGIEHLVIPGTVTSIGGSAFAGSAVTTATIGEGITVLPDSIFKDCWNLETVTLNSTLREISIMAFYNCVKLKNVVLPETVTAIGFSAFAQCYEMETVIFTGDAPSFDWDCFRMTPAYLYYPCENETWTEDAMELLGYYDGFTWAKNHGEQCEISGKEPTCTDPGLSAGAKCANCGEIITPQEVIPAKGHSFADGVCTICGEKDPNFNPEGLLGDADGSGEVDYVDAMIVLQYHTGVVGNDALVLSQCDVDGSGEVDYVDAMMILQYHTGVISGF